MVGVVGPQIAGGPLAALLAQQPGPKAAAVWSQEYWANKGAVRLSGQVRTAWLKNDAEKAQSSWM